MRRSDLQVWISAESCNGLQNSKHRHDTPLWFASLELRMQNFARFVRRSDLQIWNSAESCNDLQNSKRRHDSCGALICKFGTLQSLAMACEFKTSARFVRCSALQVWNSAESRNGLRNSKRRNYSCGILICKFGTLQNLAMACTFQNFRTIRRSDPQIWNSAEFCNGLQNSKRWHDTALWFASPQSLVMALHKFKTSARLVRRNLICKFSNGLKKIWPAKFKMSVRFGALMWKFGTLRSLAMACKFQNVGTLRVALWFSKITNLELCSLAMACKNQNVGTIRAALWKIQNVGMFRAAF